LGQPHKTQTVLDALDSFKKKMIEANQLKYAISQRFLSELRALKEQKERGDMPGLEGLPRSAHNMFYHDLRDGTAKFYGAKRVFIDDEISAAHLHKNRHYQWVLAEAYEDFERFITDLYAAIGYVDPDFWPVSDFGNIRLGEIIDRDINWFVAQAMKKRDKPNGILNSLRSAFPNLRKVEVDNKLGVHAVFELVMISKLRHLIVHNSGRVDNKAGVVTKILAESAINAKDKEVMSGRAGRFFNVVKASQETHVFLLERGIPDLPIATEDNLAVLLSFLVAYAQLLTEEALRYFYDKGLVSGADGALPS
jgi:hypothetical protein